MLASVFCFLLLCGVIAGLNFHGKGKKNVETPSKVESVDSTKVKENVDTVNVDFPKRRLKLRSFRKQRIKVITKKTTSTVGEEATRRKERR